MTTMTAQRDGVRPQISFVDQTGSTNDDARELARAGAPHGAAVAALRQTAGRGRRGHTWVSPQGNLYLSVVLRPQVPMQHFMGLSAVCALGALAALREDAGVARAALKWPNDVVLGAGKLAGILVEAGTGAGGVYAVCGIGVNLARASGDSAPADFDSPHALERACVVDAVGEAGVPAFEDFAQALRDRIVDAVDAWAADVLAGHAQAGPLAPVLNDYYDAIPLLGHQVAIFAPDGTPCGEGVFAGIDCWGRATVHRSDGQDVDYAAEQVSLRSLDR